MSVCVCVCVLGHLSHTHITISLCYVFFSCFLADITPQQSHVIVGAIHISLMLSHFYLHSSVSLIYRVLYRLHSTQTAPSVLRPVSQTPVKREKLEETIWRSNRGGQMDVECTE